MLVYTLASDGLGLFKVSKVSNVWIEFIEICAQVKTCAASPRGLVECFVGGRENSQQERTVLIDRFDNVPLKPFRINDDFEPVVGKAPSAFKRCIVFLKSRGLLARLALR